MFSLYPILPSRLLDLPFTFEVKGTLRSHIEVGEIGERMAKVYLRRCRAKVLYRNYRGPHGGELDLVVREGDVLCFVEVKTRKKRIGSRPLDAVDLQKQKLIERGARAWLKLLPDNDFLWRFDVVEVVLEEGELPLFNWVKEAF